MLMHLVNQYVLDSAQKQTKTSHSRINSHRKQIVAYNLIFFLKLADNICNCMNAVIWNYF